MPTDPERLDEHLDRNAGRSPARIPAHDATPDAEPSLSHPARVFDLHCDTIDLLAMRDREPYAGLGLHPGDEGFTDLARNRAAVSLERMEDFAWCQCFAVWVPDAHRGPDARDFYAKARDFFFDQVERHRDRVAFARDARQVDGILERGLTCAFLTLENSTPVDGDIAAVHRLAEDGVKMVTLTWNGKNAVGSGHETEDGLTAFGREVVSALEAERVIVDASHLNDAGFADLLETARRPFVASHSNARAVCGAPRNLTDDQFRAIRDMGGLVGVNFYNGFITERDCAGTGGATPEELLAHVEHFLDVGGERTLALGSDWDGSDVPHWLDTCDKVGNLRHLLAERFGTETTERIFFTNARDFFVRNETA